MSDYDRIRDEVLAAIAKSGKCYLHEARSIALELQQFRAAQPKQTESEWSPYSMIFPQTP
jgi:hypothetical protein